MKTKREQLLYHVSERLGIEIMVLEVGRTAFVPEQIGYGGAVDTRKGATLDWMAAALERPTESLTWTHTHPNMSAFFSARDEAGSHGFYDMVQRPITAVVLGRDAGRHLEQIDAAWIEAHPKPEPYVPIRQEPLWRREPYESEWWRGRGGDGYHRPLWEDDYWNDGYRKPYNDDPYQGWERGKDGILRLKKAERGATEANLRKVLAKIHRVWGQEMLVETLDAMGFIQLIRQEASGL